MITGPAADRLTRTFQERVALIGERAARRAAAEWLRLASYDEADVALYASRTAVSMNAVKAAAVRTGTAYYSTLGQFRPPSVRVSDVPVVHNPREPFIAYWNALDGGNPWDAAVQSGTARAEATGRNLATSASRQAGDVTLRKANQRPEGWSRNTDGKACEWCRGLTAYVFPTAEAADFGHDRCGCSVAPVIRVE